MINYRTLYKRHLHGQEGQAAPDIQALSFAYCTNGHRKKLVATFCELGLLAYCKECRRGEVLITWAEMDEYRKALQAHALVYAAQEQKGGY